MTLELLPMLPVIKCGVGERCIFNPYCTAKEKESENTNCTANIHKSIV